MNIKMKASSHTWLMGALENLEKDITTLMYKVWFQYIY